ncbi:MAG TPA: class I SAM-dependent methyltransferase [Anaerolineales bacterium]|nr:class I SAM-dependent methyltransferase [Anaerolineales bacterium]
MRNQPTRGTGLLEPALARLRARKANELIPDSKRSGRILDIGCGSNPYFLAHTYFREKYAIDRLPTGDIHPEIEWQVLDLNSTPSIPYPDSYFDVITSLAVVEHLNPTRLVSLLQDTHRVLKPGGVLIITTPAAWTTRLLKALSRINLVSQEEIDEHEFQYTLPLLGWYLGASNFELGKIRFGTFEFLMNLWAVAVK